MQRLVLFTSAACCFWLATSATYAVDTLVKKKVGDREQVRISGTVSLITTDEVRIKDNQNKEHVVPVNEVESVRFEQEPRNMFVARGAALRGAYEEAIRMFGEFTDAELNLPAAKEDKNFYIAFATAQLAMTGGEVKVADAQKLLDAFVKASPQSYHMLEASQLLGDLYIMEQKYDDAAKAYDKLIGSSAVGYKMTGSILKGYALLAQNKVDDAQRLFQSVDSMGDSGNPQDVQLRYAAKIGYAGCLGRTNPTEAIKVVDEVIEKTDEDPNLYAKAYNTLGACYTRNKNSKEALLAYLKVDVLYFQSPQEHAEALKNLYQLWNSLTNLPNARDRATESLEKLRARYPSSPQARSLSGS